MSKPREYQWTTEEPLLETKVRVTAYVSGRDTPARGPTYSCGGSPPEYRDVEIVVERSFCPSEPDKCKGCEWEDITESAPRVSRLPFSEGRWQAWFDTLREKAIEKDNDAADEARERATEVEHLNNRGRGEW